MWQSTCAVLILLTACMPERIPVAHSFDESGQPCTTYQMDEHGVYVTDCAEQHTSPEPIPSLALPN